MTAVIGILNRRGIAVAADSAVTVRGKNGAKIYNNANKIFTLSKFHPVGVMIYNSASIMGAPWETLIKVYREELGDKYFDTLSDYQVDFIRFLKSHHFFTTDEIQKANSKTLINDVIQEISRVALQNNIGLIENPTEENKGKIIELLREQIEKYLILFNDGIERSPEFVEYTFEQFADHINDVFELEYQSSFIDSGYNLGDESKQRLLHVIFNIVISKTYVDFAGIIFVGFGNNEIFPSLIPLKIADVVHNRLRYFVDDSDKAVVSGYTSGYIKPYAQTDVIDTVLLGVDSKLGDVYINQFGEFFKEFTEKIKEKLIGVEAEGAKNYLNSVNVDELIGIYREQIDQVRISQHVEPLINAIANLSKEDLAEMAESLIYLTYLKRRITFDEESVGGPVDVAIISKGDGFVWVKRKHYFKADLNPAFFSKYLKL